MRNDVSMYDITMEGVLNVHVLCYRHCQQLGPYEPNSTSPGRFLVFFTVVLAGAFPNLVLTNPNRGGRFPQPHHFSATYVMLPTLDDCYPSCCCWEYHVERIKPDEPDYGSSSDIR